MKSNEYEMLLGRMNLPRRGKEYGSVPMRLSHPVVSNQNEFVKPC